MKKTVRETLTQSKELPFWIRKRALKNIEIQKPEDLDLECSGLNHALCAGFMWKDSPEGRVFWAMVSCHLDTPDNPLYELPKAKDIKISL